MMLDIMNKDRQTDETRQKALKEIQAYMSAWYKIKMTSKNYGEREIFPINYSVKIVYPCSKLTKLYPTSHHMQKLIPGGL